MMMTYWHCWLNNEYSFLNDIMVIAVKIKCLLTMDTSNDKDDDWELMILMKEMTMTTVTLDRHFPSLDRWEGSRCQPKDQQHAAWIPCCQTWPAPHLRLRPHDEGRHPEWYGVPHDSWSGNCPPDALLLWPQGLACNPWEGESCYPYVLFIKKYAFYRNSFSLLLQYLYYSPLCFAGVLWYKPCQDVPVPGLAGCTRLWDQLLYWHVLSYAQKGPGWSWR